MSYFWSGTESGGQKTKFFSYLSFGGDANCYNTYKNNSFFSSLK